nr:cytochrome P450 [Haloechinothrix aidingensis]
MDPPEHTAIRKKLMPFFTPKAVEGWRPVVEDLVTAFIDRVIEDGSCEFVQDISSPVPAALTMMMLGANTDNWRVWADANHHTTMYAPGSAGHAEAVQEMMTVMQELSELITDRQQNPGTDESADLITFLCTTEFDGRRLTHDEILLHAVLLVAGGVDTTTAAMTAAVKWLGEHPQERERLKSGGPELMKTAIEEFLRVSAPVSGLARTATCPYEIAGQKIHPGERLLMMFSAANFDPTVFHNPEQVDLQRSPNRHAAFGLGAHRCIGQHIARLELETVLWQVLERMPDYVVDSNPTISPDVGVNQSWVALPMTFTAGTKVGSTFKPID